MPKEDLFLHLDNSTLNQPTLSIYIEAKVRTTPSCIDIKSTEPQQIRDDQRRQTKNRPNTIWCRVLVGGGTRGVFLVIYHKSNMVYLYLVWSDSWCWWISELRARVGQTLGPRPLVGWVDWYIGHSVISGLALAIVTTWYRCEISVRMRNIHEISGIYLYPSNGRVSGNAYKSWQS